MYFPIYKTDFQVLQKTYRKVSDRYQFLTSEGLDSPGYVNLNLGLF